MPSQKTRPERGCSASSTWHRGREHAKGREGMLRDEDSSGRQRIEETRIASEARNQNDGGENRVPEKRGRNYTRVADRKHSSDSRTNRQRNKSVMEQMRSKAALTLGLRSVQAHSTSCGRPAGRPYSDGVPQESEAASSKRVLVSKKIKLRRSVGPLRCLAMMSSAWRRSSSEISLL